MSVCAKHWRLLRRPALVVANWWHQSQPVHVLWWTRVKRLDPGEHNCGGEHWRHRHLTITIVTMLIDVRDRCATVYIWHSAAHVQARGDECQGCLVAQFELGQGFKLQSAIYACPLFLTTLYCTGRLVSSPRSEVRCSHPKSALTLARVSSSSWMIGRKCSWRLPGIALSAAGPETAGVYYCTVILRRVAAHRDWPDLGVSRVIYPGRRSEMDTTFSGACWKHCRISQTMNHFCEHSSPSSPCILNISVFIIVP